MTLPPLPHPSDVQCKEAEVSVCKDCHGTAKLFSKDLVLASEKGRWKWAGKVPRNRKVVSTGEQFRTLTRVKETWRGGDKERPPLQGWILLAPLWSLKMHP